LIADGVIYNQPMNIANTPFGRGLSIL